MCGIAGILRFDGGPVDGAALRAMADSIAHRGPDAEGFFRAPGVGLAHRRLSIIDLGGGAQPLGNEDGSIQIVFNGEIYNFRELSHDLAARGHRFRTRSDTEAIVHLYEEEGPDLVRRLRGMFAFAIWDAPRRTLLLARDRVGKKPLYWGIRRGALYFGSELKAVLAGGPFPREPDEAAIEAYLALGYVPAPLSALAGIRKLAPASVLVARLAKGGGAPSIEARRYWSPEALAEPRVGPEASERGLAAEYGARIDEAVGRRLVSDVPLGAFLSGGIDSSAVVSSMAARRPGEGGPVRTFTIAFDEARHDESADAREVAAHLGAAHRELPVRADALAALPELVWHLDEPFADSSAIPSWYVCKAAREHVAVVLTGDGGDEVFGGYRRYLPGAAERWADRLLPALARRALGALAARTPPGTRGRAFARHAARGAAERYFERVGVFAFEERAEVLRASRAAFARPEEVVCSVVRRGARTLADAYMLADLLTYLPEDVCVKVDRMSMAHGLETRAPLLDHTLIEAALGLDISWKIRDGAQKVILRRAVEPRLPPRALEKRKHGFSAPVAEWLRRGPLGPLAARALLDGPGAARGLLRRAEVERLLGEHRAGRRDHSTKLWALLMLELWFRTYIDAAPSLDRARAVVESLAPAPLARAA